MAQIITNPSSPTRNERNLRADEIRSATVHCAQARLLLLRVASHSELDLVELRDLAGILHHVLVAIEELGR